VNEIQYLEFSLESKSDGDAKKVIKKFCPKRKLFALPEPHSQFSQLKNLHNFEWHELE
jgi:hypothetical protein